MAKYKVGYINTKQVWERFLSANKPGTFLQSWNWGEVNRKVGYKIVRLGFYKNDQLSAVAQLIHQPARRGPHFLIPGGPVADYSDTSFIDFIFGALRSEATANRVWFVRVRPDISSTPDLELLLQNVGLISAPMHVHGENTLILDLSLSKETLVQQMRKTTRYLVKKSLTEDIQIRVSNDPADNQLLVNLQGETVKRHKFVGFQQKLIEAELAVFSQDNQAKLYICSQKSKPLIAAIVIYYADKAFYHISGSSEQARGTNAAYALQWRMISDAKTAACRLYDFWGIAPNNDPHHRFAGVTLFKTGFGGYRQDWLHAHDLPISPLYWTTYVFEKGRKYLRHL